MDMLRETVPATQDMEALGEASKVLLVLPTIGSHGTDTMVERRIRTSTPAWRNLLWDHQSTVLHGTGAGYPQNLLQPTNPGEVKVGRVKPNPTGGTLGRLRPEQGLQEASVAGPIRIFRTTLVVAIALGREMTEDGGKTELIVAGAWIGGTMTTILIMVAGEVGVLNETETEIELASGKGIYIVGNLYHCVYLEVEPFFRLLYRGFCASLEFGTGLV